MRGRNKSDKMKISHKLSLRHKTILLSFRLFSSYGNSRLFHTHVKEYFSASLQIVVILRVHRRGQDLLEDIVGWFCCCWRGKRKKIAFLTRAAFPTSYYKGASFAFCSFDMACLFFCLLRRHFSDMFSDDDVEERERRFVKYLLFCDCQRTDSSAHAD